MRKIRILVIAAAMSAALLGGTVLASADAGNGINGSFLCPIVGDGVLNATAHNNDNGVTAITPAPGTSLLPGNNMAGTHANAKALNSKGPDQADAGPGGNPDYSPIWPYGG